MARDQRYTLKEKLIGAIVALFGLGLAIFVFTSAVMPLFHQALAWLRTGEIPPRDLYWFTSDVRCEATNWEARGWEGMEACRPDYINFTDWVGIDKILNFVFDLHMTIIVFGGLILIAWIVAVLVEEYRG